MPRWALIVTIALVLVIVAAALTDSITLIIVLGKVHRLQEAVCHLAASCAPGR